MKDEVPYLSRSTLFERINRLNCENDNLHERIRQLEAAFEAQSEKITLDPDLDDYEQELPV